MTPSAPHRLVRFGAGAVFLLVLGLQLTAVARQSLVADAPYHLLAGHQALRYGQNTLNLEHPPMVKLMAAKPLLAEAPLAPPLTVDGVLAASLRVFDDPERLERVRWRSRLVVLAAFGLPFLVFCFLLGREVAGSAAGVVLALVMGLSISSLPYLSILQTDAAVALGFTATAVAALRYVKAPGLMMALTLGLSFSLALAAKFSGVLALPLVVAALALARGRGARRRLVDLAVAGLAALALPWHTYATANRHYDPEVGRDTIARYCRGEALIVEGRMEPYEEPLLAVERVSPSLAQWLTGLVGIRFQNAIGVYPTYAFGTLSSQGRWWYFPAVLLVKTPLVVLAASLAALLASWGRRRWDPEIVVLGATVAIYLGAAVTSSYNLGVRHLLPILPLLYLPAAAWAARRRGRAAALVGVLAVEAVALAPLWMSATNTWWLGRLNPTRFALSAGDAEYHQNFLALAATARERGVERLHVLFPLISGKEVRAYLPDAVVLAPGAPLENGWYAVNVTAEQYLRAIPRTRPEDVRGYASLARLAADWTPLWQEIVARGDDHGYVAATFHLYHLRE